ncbi:MAG: T9SS type A sorting domain-containing protein [Bacteroidales bacterium]|nr:T9SS type A sorting domain-containing protein [Bacteroidales bacterium]
MKKHLLIGIFFIALINFGFGQSLSLTLTDGTAIENGATVEFIEEPGNDIIESYVNVTNNANNALDVKVKKIEIDLLENTMNTFCWGESCFPPSTFVSPNPITIDPGETEDSFHGEYYPQGNDGTSSMMYVFFDSNNPDDSVSVYVDYTSGYVGVEEEPEAIKPEINAYPNPAGDYTNIDYTLPPDHQGQARIAVRNVLGAMVKSVPVTKDAAKVRINVNDLKEGVYFYTLVLNNELLITRKLVVR